MPTKVVRSKDLMDAISETCNALLSILNEDIPDAGNSDRPYGVGFIDRERRSRKF